MESIKKKMTWEEFVEFAQREFGIPESELSVITTENGGIQFGRFDDFGWIEKHEIENVDLDLDIPAPGL